MIKNTVYLISMSFFICIFSFCSNGKQKKNIIWKETIGKLDPSGSISFIYYSVNENLYKSRFFSRNYGAVMDEKYTMRYNIENPKEIEIDYWNPVFEKGEYTCFLFGKIKKIAWINFTEPKHIIRYVYEYCGHEIEKEQCLPPDYLKIYPNLEKGQYFQVECWDKNPCRAIIHLDKPVSDSMNRK